MTRRPYIVELRELPPRFPADHDHGLITRPLDLLEEHLRARLADDRCIACLAYSQYARRQFRHQARRLAPPRGDRGQAAGALSRLAAAADEPKPGSGELKLLFTGYDFMRKGGPVLLRAHERLRAAGIPVTTTDRLGAQLDPHDYVGPSSAAFVERELQRLSAPGVSTSGASPNARVLELMEEADYFVLPTFHDTFGYVALEALAGGTPVIATATCALPEVVEHGRSGYLIPFENDADVGRWPWISRRETALRRGLRRRDRAHGRRASTAILTEAFDARASYSERSAAAIERMRSRFDPTAARDELELDYERCRAW